MKQNTLFRSFQNHRIVLAMAVMLALACPAIAASGSYTDKLTHSRFFREQLVWVGQTAPSEAESEELWNAFGVGQSKSIDEALGGLGTFVKAHPNSPWLPSLQANMGVYYQQHGYITPALNNWEAAWNITCNLTDFKGKEVADFALVNWLQLLASLGRIDTMKQLFDQCRSRPIPMAFQGPFKQSWQAYSVMLKHPEFSYRCGTYALDAVARALYGKDYFKQIWEQPSPQTGFSMADLVALSESNHLNMVAVERPAGDELVVPSVVHWRQNHYAAIIARNGDSYNVVDPTFRTSRWLTSDAINAESSGQFLVSAKQVPATWRVLSKSAAARIFGKGYPDFWGQPPCPPCSTCPCPCNSAPGSGGSGGNNGNSGNSQSGPTGCSTCSQNGPPLTYSSGAGTGGMPDWTVLEPWCDEWITDEPLAYQPARGPRISFKLTYCVSGDVYWPWVTPYMNPSTFFNLGYLWNCSWLSYVVSADHNDFNDGVTLYAPGGGVRTYSDLSGTAPDFSTSTRMLMETNSAGDTIGFKLFYPSGAEDVYEQAWTNTDTSVPFYFMTRQLDPSGQGTTFVYSYDTNDDIFLQYVIDGDGKTNTLSYTNMPVNGFQGTCQISGVKDPYGRSISLYYDQNSTALTNIVDEDGMSSWVTYGQFEYGENGVSGVNQLNTPYGATTFYYTSDGPDPCSIITEPNGSHQMFLYFGDNPIGPQYDSAIPPVYSNPLYVPTNRPDDGALGGSNTLDNPDWNNPSANDEMQWADSFYWNPQQFLNLSSNFISTYPYWSVYQLTTNDFILARMRHWNQGTNSTQGSCLSMERDPSPDNGISPGEMTWYDYAGKPDYNVEGTSGTPILKIKVLPDGTEWYQINQLDQWNNPTNVITTYSVNGTVLTRTNSYTYAPNGQDLLRAVRADGATTSYGYTNHQVLFMTNALSEVTSFLYNTNEQQISVTEPNGQVTTSIYGADGQLAEQIVAGISTNYYTWSNALVYTHTDERGLTVTNSWDALNRLTNVLYPDHTSVSYVYSNLDLVHVIDRMGHTTSYTYDSIREMTSMTDANGHPTSYGYCECGALYSITDALNNVTVFIHDNQGNLIQTFYPDGYSVSNSYNLLRQPVSSTDRSGMIVNNWYNNQGLLIASSNNVGLVRSLAYDIDDRLTNSTDANHVSVGISYDNLDRLRTRSYPDSGVEKYGYTPDVPGPTTYTNQIGKVWLYGYDSLDRKTNEVCASVTTNAFAYNGAGDLVSLTDGNGNMTTWGYDQYGRVTNKLDAAHGTNFVYAYDDDNRLTNRWTPAKGATAYSYDPVGNLTGVGYHVSPSISLSYDADNRLTGMVDGIGTTAYSYDQVGQLLSEGGLWPDDTVNYTYQNRLRTQLSLAHPNGSSWTNGYAYDDARRLTGVASPAGIFDYAYDPVKLDRVDGLALPNGAYITNTFDSVARLLGTALVSGSGTNLDSQNYVYNTAGQRTSETNAPGDNRTYSYDNEGELTKALAHEPNGSTRFMDEAKYTYDAAGNMTSKEPGFNQYQTVNYTLNNLNEIVNSLMGASTGFGWGISNAVSGSTTAPATNVLVNSVPATLYADNSFYAIPFTISNGPNTYKAIAWDTNGSVSSNSSTVYAIPTNSFYGYDLNGNLTNDGYKSFAYDDENELISVWVANAWSNNFAYDGKMRRRIERDYSWNGSGWAETNEIHFIYDGNVTLEERNASNVPLVSYTRGNDLSGGLQGAGGIGGLLARTTYGQELPGAPTTAFYHADGNGNVTAILYPSQQLAAKYLYDPFGNTLAMSGPLENFNKYRFSSKEWDDNSGLYYYGYRFYEPSLQRWQNRDPILEFGSEVLRMHYNHASVSFVVVDPEPSKGPDLYEFVGNDPVKYFDLFGLDMNSPLCKALAVQWIYWNHVAVFDDSFGNGAGAYDAMARTQAIFKAMQKAGCFDPPPPPPPNCPVLPRAPAPAPTPSPYRHPPGYPPPILNPAVAAGGVGIGIGIGATLEWAWPIVFAL